MKKNFMIVLLGLLLVIPLFTGWTEQGPSLANAQTEAAEKRTISVSGTGSISVKPDVAYLQFGVETEADMAKQAQSENAKIYEGIKDVLQKQGIKPEDIQTVNYQIYPHYDYRMEENGKEQVLTGYRVHHILQVTYRNVDDIGGLLDQLSSAGINRVQSIRFGVEDRETLERQALEKAVDAARAKAEALAKAEGLTIKGVVQIQESGGYTPVYTTFAKESLDSAAGAPSTEIHTGELTIRKTVQVVYEF